MKQETPTIGSRFVGFRCMMDINCVPMSGSRSSAVTGPLMTFVSLADDAFGRDRALPRFEEGALYYSGRKRWLMIETRGPEAVCASAYRWPDAAKSRPAAGASLLRQA
jgi:hypothetical protein